MFPDLVHTGEPLGTPAQAVPHFPQFEASLLRSTQASPQSANPALQASPHFPAPQAGSAFAVVGHAAPQLPQFCGSEATATQEPVQLPCPTGQVDLHTPPEHASPAEQA